MGCGRAHYDTPSMDAALDATGLDARSMDAPTLDAALDASGLDAPPIDAGRGADAPSNDSSGADAPGPDAFRCPLGARVVGTACVPVVQQLDLDGDGYGDLVVGAQDAAPSAQGAAFFYRGSPTGPVAAGTFRAGNADERVGFTVIDAHDTNGDDLDDVLVSGHNFGSGQAYVILGGAGPFDSAAGMLTAAPSSEFSQFMTSLGDLNGDGDDDVAVAEDGAARVHVFRSTGAGLEPTPSFTFTAPDLLRIEAGDVSGDGLADIVLRGTDHFHVYFASGASYPGPVRTTGAPAGGTFTGLAVANLDGDGNEDVVVGATDGALRIYRGPISPGGGPVVVAPIAGTTILGAFVENVGDLDHDGHDDVAVTADLAAGASVQVFLGRATPPYLEHTTTIALPSPATARTTIALGATDLDGDGAAELVIGDPALRHAYVYDDPTGSPSLEHDLTDTASSFGFSVATR